MQNAETSSPDLQKDADRVIELALEEDIGSGDVTCESVIPEEAVLLGTVVFRERGILCGLSIAQRVFKRVHETIEINTLEADGDDVQEGQAVLTVRGPARAVLTAERTALNFLQRLSGVATMTHEFVQRIAHTPCHILDTRKTTPGWRRLEKYAVTCGGGLNHRMGLYDRVLIKDNHLALRKALLGSEDWASMVKKAREVYPEIPVEIEVDSVDQFKQAMLASPDWILLDNMTLDELTECVHLRTGETQLEASGGVTLETVTAIAETGVDAISVGALTHSVPAVDISLDYGLTT